MTAETIVGQADAIRPLLTEHEANHRRVDLSAGDVATIINPAAGAFALLAAVASRVDRLNVTLQSWSNELGCSTKANELAETLAPLAEEADQLLHALREKLPKLDCPATTKAEGGAA